MISPITDASGFLYSAVYTALPTVIVGIYDQDLSHGTLLSYPQLYGPGLRDERYNRKLFVLIMLDSVWQSLVTAFVPFLFYSGTLDDSSLGDIWIVSVVLLVNIHLAMDVFSWNWILLVTLWGVTAIAMGCIVAIDASPSMPGYWYFLSHFPCNFSFCPCMISKSVRHFHVILSVNSGILLKH